MEILIVEDDGRISKPLQIHLNHQQHAVEVAADGERGLEMALAKHYDFILLDIMLPKLDGLTVCHKLRNASCSSAIIMLTARDTTSDKVTGLEVGADDYIAKPFELTELSARMKAISRRGKNYNQNRLQFQNLDVDPDGCVARYRDQNLNLTPTEFRLLSHFLANPLRIYNKQELIDLLWHHNSTVNDDIIKTHMKGLRNKLKNVGADPDSIETVYGFGYRLKQNA